MTTKAADNDFQKHLRDSHEKLETILRGVAESIRSDRRDAMHDDFCLFEKKLLAHMDWEEMHLLTPYERISPKEGAQLRADHAHFRKALGDFGIAIDIHAVRAEQFDKFAEELVAHASREEEMYELAAKFIDADRRTAVALHMQQFVI